MPAYVLSMMTIHDPETYRKYTDRTPPVVKKYGGKFLTRGEPVTRLEGEEYLGRLVILEFPSKEKSRSLVCRSCLPRSGYFSASSFSDAPLTGSGGWRKYS